MKINKKYKDRLFRMAFSEKEDLLELYNAMNGSDYRNPDDLEITTLEDVIYMGTKNDMAFIIDEVLNLWEHQSTQNPNMPLRGLFYFTDEYRKFITQEDLNIYGSRRIMLPAPQYVIFYNGLPSEPDRMELALSESFSKKNKNLLSCIELKALVVNINRGHNKELMRQCRRLKEYAEFVGRVRECLNNGLTPIAAVEQTVNSCIHDGIMAEFLSSHRAEVCEVILTEYDEQKHIADEKEVSWEDGLKKGITLGDQTAMIRLVRKKFEKNYNQQRAADELELDPACVARIYRLLERDHTQTDLQIAGLILNSQDQGKGAL